MSTAQGIFPIAEEKLWAHPGRGHFSCKFPYKVVLNLVKCPSVYLDCASSCKVWVIWALARWIFLNTCRAMWKFLTKFHPKTFWLKVFFSCHCLRSKSRFFLSKQRPSKQPHGTLGGMVSRNFFERDSSILERESAYGIRVFQVFIG